MDALTLLSPRERQMFDAIAIGTPPAKIASDLSLSVRTIDHSGVDHRSTSEGADAVNDHAEELWNAVTSGNTRRLVELMREHTCDSSNERATAARNDEDPTPWCTACGARRRADCHCLPIADNE